MNYFKDVYLKRLKLNGENRQEIIQSHKEHKFDLVYQKRSIYKATCYRVNDEETNMQISLQPHRWNENSLISNVLTSTSLPRLKTGDVIYTRMKIKKRIQEKIWIIIVVDDDITQGYQGYKVVGLDSEMNITDEYGTSIYSAPAKIINASQSFAQDTMVRSKSELGYREPATNRILITQASDELKKGLRFEMEDRRWEIASEDIYSVKGVYYVYISERLQTENEPISSEELLVGEDTNFFLNGR